MGATYTQTACTFLAYIWVVSERDTSCEGIWHPLQDLAFILWWKISIHRFMGQVAQTDLRIVWLKG